MKSARLALLLGSVMITAMITGGGLRFVSDEGTLPTCPEVVDDSDGADEGVIEEEPVVVESTTETDVVEEDSTEECADPEDGTGSDEEVVEGDDGEGDDVEGDDAEVDDVEGDADAGLEETEAGHGKIVSTVAHCAPRGKDARLLELDFANHGAFVRAAAHGDTLTAGGADYDLSTLEGAEALCAALEAMLADDVPADDLEGADDTEDPELSTASKDKAKGVGKNKVKPVKSKADRPKRAKKH